MQKFTLDKLPKKVLSSIDLQTAFMASKCVLAAEKFELFRKLSGKNLTANAICKKTGVHPNRVVPFLAALMALGLLKKKGKLYSNTSLSEKNFVKERSPFWTNIYSGECNEEYKAFSVLEEMLTTNRDYQSILGTKRKDYLELLRDDPEFAWGFTNMLFYAHQPQAKALAKSLDLSKYNSILDVGGGSGVMSMALVNKFKNLKACVLDIKGVIDSTKKIIKREGFVEKVNTRVGDMNKKLPEGFDVIMYCDAGNPSTQTFKMIYDTLPSKGLLVMVDYLSSEDWTEPYIRLMWQLRSQKFWLVNRKQAVDMIRKAGFKGVKLSRLINDSWLITGRKA